MHEKIGYAKHISYAYFLIKYFNAIIFCYRGKMLLGYSDTELATMGGYDLVHYDDLAYVASAHQECKYN